MGKMCKSGRVRIRLQVYWGGGSVSGSLCDARWQKPKKDVSARLEDGTVNFLSIAAIKYGFAALQVGFFKLTAENRSLQLE